jgi:hypothetical protein
VDRLQPSDSVSGSPQNDLCFCASRTQFRMHNRSALEEAHYLRCARPKQFNPGISDNQFSARFSLHLSPAWKWHHLSLNLFFLLYLTALWFRSTGVGITQCLPFSPKHSVERPPHPLPSESVLVHSTGPDSLDTLFSSSAFHSWPSLSPDLLL